MLDIVGYFASLSAMTHPKKTVKIACDVKLRVDLDSLEGFQGDLKILSDSAYAGLKNEIVETGFAFPVFVWKDSAGKTKILGGHQRVTALKKMRQEGFEIPKVPVVLVDAKDEKEAKRRILQDVSQYGKVNQSGLVDFMKDSHFTLDDIRDHFVLPEVDMKLFESSFFPDSKEVAFTATQGAKEIDQKDFDTFAHSCPKCGFGFN